MEILLFLKFEEFLKNILPIFKTGISWPKIEGLKTFDLNSQDQSYFTMTPCTIYFNCSIDGKLRFGSEIIRLAWGGDWLVRAAELILALLIGFSYHYYPWEHFITMFYSIAVLSIHKWKTTCML